LKIIFSLQHDMSFHLVVPLLFFGTACCFCAVLIAHPIKMAAPAPCDNVVAANANNGCGGANAAVIGGDAAVPFALAAGAGCGPVPGCCGGGRGGGRGGSAVVVAGAVLLLVLLVVLLLVLEVAPDSQPLSGNTSMNL
jgi:hypothetical protein